MKQNPYAVVREVSDSACIGFDHLNGTVEVFSIDVDLTMLNVVGQALFVSAQLLMTFLTDSRQLLITLFDQALKNLLAAPLYLCLKK